MIVIERIYHELGTLGTLYVAGKRFYTLERTKDDAEHPCIPEGEYELVRDHTGKHQWWAIPNVPGHTNVEMHEGNEVKDSLACILLGESITLKPDSAWLSHSVLSLQRLESIIGSDTQKLVIRELRGTE